MSILVTDQGFEPLNETVGVLEMEHLRNSETGGHTVSIPSDIDVDELKNFLDQTATLRIEFPSFADGRGFSLAKRLRLMGYRGRLRAAGHVLADQYPNARRSGFDEVEIADDLAARQPEDQWLVHANWAEHDYQARLRQVS